MTERYFLDECNRLWKLTGERSFWADRDRADLAFQALGHLALTIPGLSEAALATWRAVCYQYERVGLYMATAG